MKLAIAAPFIPYWGISHKLKSMVIIAKNTPISNTAR